MGLWRILGLGWCLVVLRFATTYIVLKYSTQFADLFAPSKSQAYRSSSRWLKMYPNTVNTLQKLIDHVFYLSKSYGSGLFDETFLASYSLHPVNEMDKGHLQTASKILRVISRYQLSCGGSHPQTFSKDSKFIQQVYAKVAAGDPVLMCLPAFPFKSPNTSRKVLGYLPDKAEEFALAHLNGLCNAIKDVYEFGAKLMIISDGLVYNGKRLR